MPESIEQVLRHLGNRLEDDAPETERFREYLKTGDARQDLSAYRTWLEECQTKARGSGSPYFRAFQDIIVTLGQRLGFSVTYGRYSGRRGRGPAYDGLWEGPAGEAVFLEVKASAWPLTSVGQLGRYIDDMADERKQPREKVYGLYIVGDGDLRPIIEQIRGSVYSSRMRVMTTSDLMDLLELKEELDQRVGQPAAEMIRNLLLPLESIDLGNVIRLVRDLTSFTPPTMPEAEEGGEAETLPQLERKALAQLEEGTVLICPARPDGAEFFTKYKAWGFIRLREQPQYVALYIAHPESAICYLGEVERVVDRDNAPSDMRAAYPGDEWPAGKKALIFKRGRAWELSDPVRLGKDRKKAPRGPRGCTVSELGHAETMDDL